MKKILLLFIFPLVINAQVGINTTTPHSSSMLDISATDKGLLVPRISIPNLNAAAPVTTPAVSLLVYNTNTTTGVGFHYWNGTQWVPFTGAADNDWVIVGNNMYNANTGNVGVGTTTPTTKLHVENIGTPSTLLDQGFESNSIAPLTTSGNSNWVTQNTQVHTGSYSVASGTIGHSQSSTLQFNTTIPAGGASISFNYKVSSEANYDFLIFYIDGIQQAQWSGEVNWSSFTTNLSPGAHILRWTYSKDNSSISGSDKAFLDNINVFSSAPPALRIVDGNQAPGKVLTSDGNGNATWQNITNNSITDIPLMASINGMEIPVCDTALPGDTGSFSIDIKGVTTTVNWEILDRQIKSFSTNISGQEVANADVLAERLQVQYDFSPPLPFNPNGFVFMANNDSGFPDVFVLNYANKSQTSITINIARVDVFAEQSGVDCWLGQFYFDAFITD